MTALDQQGGPSLIVYMSGDCLQVMNQNAVKSTLADTVPAKYVRLYDQ